MGGVTNVVGNAASFVDLVVQTRPYGDGQGYEAEAVVEAALFDAHAPVLILPPDTDFPNLAAPKPHPAGLEPERRGADRRQSAPCR